MALTAKGRATKQRIVEGAAEYLRGDIPGEVTLDDIRAITGTSKSQIFHYFPAGKEELLLEVARCESRRVLDDQQPQLGSLFLGRVESLAGRRRGPLPGPRTELPARRAHGPGR